MKLTGIISTAALSLFIGIAVPAHALQDQQDEKKQREAKPDPKEAKPAPQEERRDREDKPAPKEEKRRDEARPAPQDERRGQENKPAPQDEKRGQENKPAPQEDRRGREDKPVPQDDRRGQPQQQREQQPRPPAQDNRQGQAQRPERAGQDQGARQSAFREHRAKSWQSEHHSWRQRGGYHGTRIPEDRFRASFGESHSFRISSFSFQIVSGSPAFLCNGFWVVLVDPIPEFWADDWFDNDDVYIVWVDDGYYLIDRRYPSVSIAVSFSA
jgi:hypothetical protein